MRVNKTASRLAVALVALMAVSAVAFAAAPVVDTETTHTSTTSDWTDGTTVQDFEANASNTSHVEAEYDSTNPKMEIIDPGTGETVVSYTATDMNQTGENSTAGTYFYAANVSHDELSGMPMDAGQNKSVTVRFTNNTSASSPATSNITVYLENQGDRTVVRVGETMADGNNVDFEATGISPPLFDSTFFDRGDIADIEQDNVAIGGNGSTTTFALANTTTADSFADGASDDAESGDLLLTQQAFVENSDGDLEPVRVYYGEAHSDADTSETYGVYDENSDEVTFYHGEDAENETSVDIHLIANDAYGATDLWTLADDSIEFGQFVVNAGPFADGAVSMRIPLEFGGLALAGGLVVGQNRLGA